MVLADLLLHTRSRAALYAHQVRAGKDPAGKFGRRAEVLDERCMSLILESGKRVDLEAPSAAIRDVLVTGLRVVCPYVAAGLPAFLAALAPSQDDASPADADAAAAAEDANASERAASTGALPTFTSRSRVAAAPAPPAHQGMRAASAAVMRLNRATPKAQPTVEL